MAWPEKTWLTYKFVEYTAAWQVRVKFWVFYYAILKHWAAKYGVNWKDMINLSSFEYESLWQVFVSVWFFRTNSSWLIAGVKFTLAQTGGVSKAFDTFFRSVNNSHLFLDSKVPIFCSSDVTFLQKFVQYISRSLKKIVPGIYEPACALVLNIMRINYCSRFHSLHFYISLYDSAELKKFLFSCLISSFLSAVVL